MSQFPFSPVHGAGVTVRALPGEVVGVIQRLPFGLRFTGAWHFHAVTGKWRPRMLIQPMAKGACGATGPNDLGAEIRDKAKSHASMRFFVNGDAALGPFAWFLKTANVRDVRSGRVVTHYALQCENYLTDKSGRFVRRVDNEWLNALFSHVVKAHIVLEPSPSQLHRAVERVNRDIRILDGKLAIRGAPIDELEVRRNEKVNLREAMISAFAEQFPNADKITSDLEAVNVFSGAEAGVPDNDPDVL